MTANVIVGFQTTGIFLLDHSVTNSKALVNVAEYYEPRRWSKEIGIKFLPLYSHLVTSGQNERHEMKMKSQHNESCELL